MGLPERLNGRPEPNSKLFVDLHQPLARAWLWATHQHGPVDTVLAERRE